MITEPDESPVPAAEETPSTSASSTAQTVYEMAARYFRHASTRRIIAVAVVFSWLIVFAFGVLIPSEGYRKVLGWDPSTKETQAATELQTKIQGLETEIARIKARQQDNGEKKPSDAGENQPAQAGDDAAGTGADGQAFAPPADLTARIDLLSQQLETLIKNPPKPKQDENKLWAFLMAAISFMPINVAVLCILAGCMGACCVSEESVKDVMLQLKSEDYSAQHGELKRKLNFLTEHPLYSALRGLVVYLLLSSGLFIFAGTQPLVGDIEQTVSLSSYIRLAGIFSFLSYLAGHDPTVFTNMIRMGNRQSVEKSK